MLPFLNLSSEPVQDYLSDGITEELTTSFSRFTGLFVIARNSAFRYKGLHTDIRKLAASSACTTSFKAGYVEREA